MKHFPNQVHQPAPNPISVPYRAMLLELRFGADELIPLTRARAETRGGECLCQ